EVGDDVLAVLLVLQSREDHLGSRHFLARIGQVGVELLRRPFFMRVLHRLRVVVIRRRAGFASDHAGEARADLVLAGFRRVTEGAFLEHFLAGRGVAGRIGGACRDKRPEHGRDKDSFRHFSVLLRGGVRVAMAARRLGCHRITPAASHFIPNSRYSATALCTGGRRRTPTDRQRIALSRLLAWSKPLAAASPLTSAPARSAPLRSELVKSLRIWPIGWFLRSTPRRAPTKRAPRMSTPLSRAIMRAPDKLAPAKRGASLGGGAAMVVETTGPKMLAFDRSAPLKSARMIQARSSRAPARLAPTNFAPTSLAPKRSQRARSAWLKSRPLRSSSLRFLPERSAACPALASASAARTCSTVRSA